ncbi:MAG: hypothetical protein ABI925_01450 [Verrucomicrobiota bacterium]
MTDSTDAGQRSGGTPLRQKYKIVFYIVAWIGALFATNPDGGLWALAYMFPLGLAAFVNLRWGNDGGWWVFAGCVAIYLVHAWLYFRSRKMPSTLLLLGLLFVLLIGNVSGCRQMIHGH